MKRDLLVYSAIFTTSLMVVRTCGFTPAHSSRTLNFSDDASILACSRQWDRGEDDEGRLLPWLEAPVDDERRPAKRRSVSLQPDKLYFNDWEVERYDHPEPQFPDTLTALTDAAWEAVAGTLYRKQRLDPNLASNAMSFSIFGYRPIRGERDTGRIGLEIDGANFLFPKESSGTAIRRVALQLGAKLSQGPWEGFEADGPTSRPVALYFNTIKQSLIASQELLVLKHNILQETGPSGRYDSITIHCLHQDDEIPRHMRQRKRAYGGLGKGAVDPTKGIILVVQPTDYNNEFRPPGPAIGVIGALQQLVARAAIHGLPAVIISPRFLEQDHHHRGWDQSGYQRSATYGGAEPPKGPTPWLMRDFTPPVFAWIGCALPLSPHASPRVHDFGDEGSAYKHSRVVLTQSVMQEGHPWHMFAVKEYDAQGKSSGPHATYQYLASTKKSSGRPPKDIIRHIFNEWS